MCEQMDREEWQEVRECEKSTSKYKINKEQMDFMKLK